VRAALSLLLLCLFARAAPAASPWAEFEAPYVIRVTGDAVELYGSFSWAVPQNVSAALARAPDARVVRLDSPGGHVQAAIEVAALIKARGLDTEVSRTCASACTIAFLAGKARVLGPDAKLGFHQAHAPGAPPETFDPTLRTVYDKAGLPAAFIDRVLRTPPRSIWFPTRDELRTAGAITAETVPAAARREDAMPPAWAPVLRSLHAASDAAVEQYADAYGAMLTEVQAASPEACWSLTHNGAVDPAAILGKATIQAIAAAIKRLREEVPEPRPFFIDTAARTRNLVMLAEAAHGDGQRSVVSALRTGSDHAAFCPALRRLLDAARTLPDGQGARALRVLLAGG
jgi:hypothetical protein